MANSLRPIAILTSVAAFLGAIALIYTHIAEIIEAHRKISSEPETPITRDSATPLEKNRKISSEPETPITRDSATPLEERTLSPVTGPPEDPTVNPTYALSSSQKESKIYKRLPCLIYTVNIEKIV